MSIKKSTIFIFVFCSVFLNFIAGIIVANFVRYIYSINTREITADETMIARALDKLSLLPWYAYVSIGVAIGIIFMIVWSLWDEDLFKKKNA